MSEDAESMEHGKKVLLKGMRKSEVVGALYRMTHLQIRIGFTFALCWQTAVAGDLPGNSGTCKPLQRTGMGGHSRVEKSDSSEKMRYPKERIEWVSS